jgi:hypothetical protein
MLYLDSILSSMSTDGPLLRPDLIARHFLSKLAPPRTSIISTPNPLIPIHTSLFENGSRILHIHALSLFDILASYIVSLLLIDLLSFLVF